MMQHYLPPTCNDNVPAYFQDVAAVEHMLLLVTEGDPLNFVSAHCFVFPPQGVIKNSSQMNTIKVVDM